MSATSLVLILYHHSCKAGTILSPFAEGQMVMRLPGISVAKCTAEYHRDKNITLRVSYGRKVNVNVEEGAAMKKGAGSKDSDVRPPA